jgi:precorrin-4 methylase
MRSPILVSSVGARPGAADLIAVRGLQRLRAEDLILCRSLAASNRLHTPNRIAVGELLRRLRRLAEEMEIGAGTADPTSGGAS